MDQLPTFSTGLRVLAVLATGALAACLSGEARSPEGEAAVLPAERSLPEAAPSSASDGSVKLLAEGVRSSGGRFHVTYQSDPDPIPVNDLFELELAVWKLPVGEQASGLLLQADADMPAHGHGMNTRPKVESLDAGAYRVRGMLFHMPGEWEIYVDITAAGVTERVTFPVLVE
jgi:hypothetical protein